ncbi:hypothetical protein AU894_26355 [Salmonella enterica subsp. enterica]|uniref:Uncharacterized protein n=1 Tax=Salmonella enterica subsp. enterica serovar Java TaxID=224729 RepID=A0A3Y9C6N0_SALEB|nr:hypothetical protein [Salmonella enterica subsp. enterica serovar Java]
MYSSRGISVSSPGFSFPSSVFSGHFACVVSPGYRIPECREGRQEQRSFEGIIGEHEKPWGSRELCCHCR